MDILHLETNKNNKMKKSIQELDKEREAKYSSILNDLGVFFAFSEDQFDTKKVDGVTYVSGYYGECIPKENVQEYIERMKELVVETKKSFTENIELDQYITYQLANHEAFYTGEINDAMYAVLGYFPDVTEEDMWRVYRTEWDKHKAYL